ncbi:MAG: hypothetical protein ABSA54_12710 [Terriglobales bacterium]|jgi:hypothetical protein
MILHHVVVIFLGILWHRIAKAFMQSKIGQVFVLAGQALVLSSQITQYQVAMWQQLFN